MPIMKNPAHLFHRVRSKGGEDIVFLFALSAWFAGVLYTGHFPSYTSQEIETIGILWAMLVIFRGFQENGGWQPFQHILRSHPSNQTRTYLLEFLTIQLTSLMVGMLLYAWFA